MEDTIAAIATAPGVGAISIIRVSGQEAIEKVNSVFQGKNLMSVQSHTIHYGFIVNDTQKIDEVLVSVMKQPKTFTTEDVVEINCHGGLATTKKILELLLQTGIRLAEPGEFTKRAFLNGRIDLLKAESIMDIISSKTDAMREMAMNQLTGKVSSMIQNLRQKIIEILANIEVNIDYPEYEDIEEMTIDLLKPRIVEIENQIKTIIDESENGKIIKEGINTAIIGRPNVGKSSLLNLLLEEEKAIVTEIEGTTRDTVEGEILIDGILFRMIDTAGIRATEDKVEQIGVEKSRKLIEKADLVLYVINQNQPLNEEDIEIIENLKNKNHILIVNKTDLPSVIDMSNYEKEHPIVYISTLEVKGIDVLKDKIKELFELEKIKDKNLNYLTNARSIAILKNTLDEIEAVKKGIAENQPIDMIEIDLKEIWNLLGEIIGETYQDELINQLFSQFCLGK